MDENRSNNNSEQPSAGDNSPKHESFINNPLVIDSISYEIAHGNDGEANVNSICVKDNSCTDNYVLNIPLVTSSISEEFIDESDGGEFNARDSIATYMNMLKLNARAFCFFFAMLLAVFPSVIKMYETSHWFREGDPSVYDNAKDWFTNPDIPFQSYFNSEKVLMRVYFFIVPYLFSAIFVAIALAVPTVKQSYNNTTGNDRIKKSRRMIGSFLRVTLPVPSFLACVGLPRCLSVGELLGAVIFLALNIATMVVRVRRSLPRGSRKITFLVDIDENDSKEAIDVFSWQAFEVWAKTLGVVSIMNLGWYLLMPIGRKSVFLEALGLSWERAIKYHRWVGYYSVAIMVVHSFSYVGIWIYGDGHPDFDGNNQMLSQNIDPWYCSKNECNEYQARMLRRNMYGFATLVLILTMTVFALPSIRRSRFELFYYIHHLFILVILFVCLHYKGSIIYIIPGIAIYGVDKLMGLYSYRKAAPVATRMLSSDVLEISFNISHDVQYKAGDYVFLNVPYISHLQWHPFSITSSPAAHGSKVFFHLKGVGSWTKQVIKEAREQHAHSNTLQVRLDGFYGVNNGVCDQLLHKDGVILVGGGIGITPMMSLAIELCKSSSIPVTLMWVVRTIDEFSIFAKELADTQYSNKNFTAKVWITMKAPEPSSTNAKCVFEEDLLKLNNSEQAEITMQHLRSIQVLRRPRDVSSPYFQLDNPSLTGYFNACVMATSILLATVAFALSTKISNADYFTNTIQDYISLMGLSFVSAFVIVWICVIIFLRGIISRLLFQKDNHLHLSVKKSNKTKLTTPCFSVDIESTQSDHDTLVQSIIEGNIGCRPNIPKEFSTAARVVVKNMDCATAEIAVLACGPPKLVESINNHINTPSTCGASLRGEQDCQVFFSFMEEDWEW